MWIQIRCLCVWPSADALLILEWFFCFSGPERLSDSFFAYLANKRTSAAACFRYFMVSVFTWEWAQFQLLISYGLKSRVVISSPVSVICTWFQYPRGLFPFSKKKKKTKSVSYKEVLNLICNQGYSKHNQREIPFYSPENGKNSGSNLYPSIGKDMENQYHHWHHSLLMGVLISATALGNSLEGNGTPLQYCCLENPMDGRAW